MSYFDYANHPVSQTITDLIQCSDGVRVEILTWQITRMLQFQSLEDVQKDLGFYLVDLAANAAYPIFIGADVASPEWVQSLNPPLDYDGMICMAEDNLVSEEFVKPYSIFMSRNSILQDFHAGKRLRCFEFPAERGGSYKWMYAATLAEQREDSMIAYLLIMQHDKYRRELNEMMRMAQRDPLTGIYNRYKLDEIVRCYISKERGEPAVLIEFDLNRFKYINDTYGHHTGDLALKAMAERLEKMFYKRGNEVLFRPGGDEFVVFMKHTTAEAAAERLTEMLRGPLRVTVNGTECVEFTASAGFSALIPEDENYKDILDRADQALYYVKNHGRLGFAEAIKHPKGTKCNIRYFES